MNAPPDAPPPPGQGADGLILPGGGINTKSTKRSSSRSRTPVAAQQAARCAIERALNTDLTMREMKVFLATLKLVSNFDRVEDRVANRQFSEATGIDERHVRRALLGLHDKGVIVRTPGRGRMASLISLEGADSAPSEGADLDARGGRSGHVDGTPEGPASEVFSEDLSEGGADPDLFDVAMAITTNPTDPQERRLELEAKLARLNSAHGPDKLLEVLQTLQRDEPPFQFPSYLVARLNAILGHGMRIPSVDLPKVKITADGGVQRHIQGAGWTAPKYGDIDELTRGFQIAWDERPEAVAS